MHTHVEDNGHGGSTAGQVLKWLAIGLLAVLALKIALALVGTVIGLALFLLFKVGPLVLLAWLGWKAWQYLTGGDRDGNGELD